MAIKRTGNKDTMGIAHSAEVAMILHLIQRSVGELPLCNAWNTSNYWLPKTNSIAKPDRWRVFRTFSRKGNRSHVSPLKNTTIHIVLATAGALFNRIRTCAFLIYKMVTVERRWSLFWSRCHEEVVRIAANAYEEEHAASRSNSTELHLSKTAYLFFFSRPSRPFLWFQLMLPDTSPLHAGFAFQMENVE